MKTAEQWYADGGLSNDAAEIQHRREIQADALRHAATLVRNGGGDNEDYHAQPIEQAADELILPKIFLTLAQVGE